MARLPASLLISLFVLCLLPGCTTRGVSAIAPYLPNLVTDKPAIIFVHGFYGSALRRKGLGSRVFYTGMEALFGAGALSLHQKELGTPPGPEVEVEGLLGAVPVVPGLYEVDVYSGFLRALRGSRAESQVLPLVYDWRDDLGLAVAKLDELVKLLGERGAPEISIVAHSMGGLVAAYYLGYGNQAPASARLNWAGAARVRKVVFLGTPFGGSMVTFRSFDKGSGLPRSERMLGADTLSSFPSMYQLLPSSAELIGPGGESVALDLFDPATWKKHRFGLLRRQGLGAGFQAARERFTEEKLELGRRWRELVQLGRSAAWPSPASLKVLNVVSSAHGTLERGYIRPEKGTLLFDPADVKAAGLDPEAVFRPGDGTVTLASASVPPALEAATKVVLTSYPHEHLFLDPAVEEEYNRFLSKPPEPTPQEAR